jgi:hypothetical protein
MWWAAPGHCGGSSRAMRASLSLPARPVNQNRNLNPNPISAFQVSALKFQLSGFSFQLLFFVFWQANRPFVQTIFTFVHV